MFLLQARNPFFSPLLLSCQQAWEWWACSGQWVQEEILYVFFCIIQNLFFCSASIEGCKWWVVK